MALSVTLPSLLMPAPGDNASIPAQAQSCYSCPRMDAETGYPKGPRSACIFHGEPGKNVLMGTLDL